MERPSTSKPRGVCKFYETPRGCFAGKKCKFLHGEDERLTPYDKNKTCRYYRAGYCKRGDRCWFLHIDGSEEPSIPNPDSDCIICYDRPVTYGLMDGCSHILCVQCIRQWRHPNNRTNDTETTNISCPYCRVPSYSVTPSSQFFPKGHPRRVEIITQYKASMARVPCRHFQNSPSNRRHCPFGKNCFYQHLNADGTPYIFPDNSNPRRWIRVRDLDDLSASLERLRRSIPEVFGNDAPQAEQQRRLVDLALDVGRTLTRFNFPQAEAFNPLGILLAHHLSQFDEAQRNAAEGTEDNDAGNDQPRPEVADAILAAPVVALARGQETPEQEPPDDGEGEGESGGVGDGIVVRNFRSTDPVPLLDNAPIDSIRVDFTTGNMRVTTESTVDVTPLDEGSSDARGDQSLATNTEAEDRTEVGTSTTSETLPEADSPPRTQVSQPDGSGETVELCGGATPGRSPTPIYHDPHPPFETDGRGRVVWSNSSEQARLRSGASPPVPPRKSSIDDTSTRREKESVEDAGPGTETGGGGHASCDGSGDRGGQGTSVGGATIGVRSSDTRARSG